MKTYFLLFSVFFLLATPSSQAVILKNYPGNTMQSALRLNAATPAMSKSAPTKKWTTSLTWRERLGIFLLKRQLRRAEKRHSDAQTEVKDKSLAIFSLLSGVAAWTVLIIAGGAINTVGLTIGVILGVAAMIFGYLANARISKDREKYGGTIMVATGLILGGLAVFLGGLYLLFVTRLFYGVSFNIFGDII